MAKVLLVGNGPSILDKPLGDKIDAFDGRVVRFNEFILEPVEYTGTRVDMWIIAHRSHDVSYMHPGLVHLMTRVPRHIQYADKSAQFRSTGVAAMFWFLEQGEEVYLHGFDHFDPKKRVHYFKHDRGFDLCAGRGHPADKQLVEQAIERGEPVRYFS